MIEVVLWVLFGGLALYVGYVCVVLGLALAEADRRQRAYIANTPDDDPHDPES